MDEVECLMKSTIDRLKTTSSDELKLANLNTHSLNEIKKNKIKALKIMDTNCNYFR